jgi:hypothetical protein
MTAPSQIWHLRPESTFFPKAQLEASVAALPHGSDVVIVLGEIDCREGLLQSVLKCKVRTELVGVPALMHVMGAAVGRHQSINQACSACVTRFFHRSTNHWRRPSA